MGAHEAPRYFQEVGRLARLVRKDSEEAAACEI